MIETEASLNPNEEGEEMSATDRPLNDYERVRVLEEESNGLLERNAELLADMRSIRDLIGNSRPPSSGDISRAADIANGPLYTKIT